MLKASWRSNRQPETQVHSARKVVRIGKTRPRFLFDICAPCWKLAKAPIDNQKPESTLPAKLYWENMTKVSICYLFIMLKASKSSNWQNSNEVNRAKLGLNLSVVQSPRHMSQKGAHIQFKPIEFPMIFVEHLTGSWIILMKVPFTYLAHSESNRRFTILNLLSSP